MARGRPTLLPDPRANRAIRRRLTLKGEFVLALLPTATVLIVLALVEGLTRAHLLFASLSASAFLIYVDPHHGMNAVRTLLIAQIVAAALGLAGYMALGSGFLSAGIAMVLTIGIMIVLDAVHPPAIATAMSFALRAGRGSNLVLFALAVGLTALLVVLERSAVWILGRIDVE